VGINPQGETVRASKNVAYILQQVADADSILYPVWQSGIDDPERLANVLSAGVATVVQGGNPSVHDAASFDGSNASLNDVLSLVDRLLLRRSAAARLRSFRCLGHQLARRRTCVSSGVRSMRSRAHGNCRSIRTETR